VYQLDKPNSVVGNHLSGTHIAVRLKRHSATIKVKRHGLAPK
jgi:hypothetical protein